MKILFQNVIIIKNIFIYIYKVNNYFLFHFLIGEPA